MMLWVFANDRSRIPYLNGYWAEFLKTTTIPYKIIGADEVQFTKWWDPIASDLATKSTHISAIVDLVDADKIESGDVFLFTDAWDYSVVPLKYISKLNDLDIKIIGVWGDSIFADNIQQWAKKVYRGSRVEHDWAKHFEKALLQTYDYSCFTNSSVQKQMNFRYRNLMRYQTWSYTGLPFEYIWRRGREVEVGRKENMILFPWPLTEAEETVFDIMQSEFREWQFYKLRPREITRKRYLELLSRAKIVFVAAKDQANQTNLFEILCYKCHPLILSTSKLKTIFGERYRFPKELIDFKSGLKIVRNRLQIQDAFEKIIYSYSDTYQILETDAEIVKDNHYSEKTFLQILNHACGK